LFEPVAGSAIIVKSFILSWLFIASFAYSLTAWNAAIDSISSPTKPLEIGFYESSK